MVPLLQTIEALNHQLILASRQSWSINGAQAPRSSTALPGGQARLPPHSLPSGAAGAGLPQSARLLRPLPRLRPRPVQPGLLRRGSAMTSSDPIADEDRHLSSQTGQAVTPVSILVSPIQRAGLVHPNDQTAVADDRAASAFGASNIVDLKTKTKKVVLTMLMKKCPSAASIFFLSALNGSRVSGEEQASEEKHEDRKLDVEMTRQELFANTERFIGNFRKELRMQRQ